MRNLKLCRGNEEYEILLDRKKIIIGHNYDKKFDLLRIIREVFSGVNQSEYSENRSELSNLLINEEQVNERKCILFDLSPNFDLNTDLKMGVKSLSIKYIESILNVEDFTDSINTINTLFLSLENEINEFQEDIKVSLHDFNIKGLLKLISTTINLDGDQANMYNLKYEELILVLLKMVSEIEKKSLYEDIFIILDIPVITQKIYSFINDLNGCTTLVFTTDYPNVLESEETLICSKITIDLANEMQLYNFFCEEYNIAYELEEIKKMLNNYVNGFEDQYTGFIKKILE